MLELSFQCGGIHCHQHVALVAGGVDFAFAHMHLVA